VGLGGLVRADEPGELVAAQDVGRLEQQEVGPEQICASALGLIEGVSDGLAGLAEIRLALVRGRRRQGKSFMLRRLGEATGGFYYQALEQERSQALEAFGKAGCNRPRARAAARRSFALVSISFRDRPVKSMYA